MFGPERHENLAVALPVPRGGRAVDLGCGRGSTVAALLSRLDRASGIVAVDLAQVELEPAVAADPRVELVVADLDGPLPFDDESFDAAVCHNVVECLERPAELLAEVSRMLVPGGHLLLGHTDYDTLVFASADVDLTRRLVHHFADTAQPWMARAEGIIGRELVALARRSPLEIVGVFAWVAAHTTFEHGGPAHLAARSIAADAARDPELAPQVEDWLADLETRARHGEFFYSLNDYAVLLRKPAAAGC
jgi:SAM-dependent methyltransferase